MAAALYNRWYDATYEAILAAPDWSRLDADVPLKVALVFSWMPQTIMNIHHVGRRRKWAVFSVARAQRTLTRMSGRFAIISGLDLLSVDMPELSRQLLPVLNQVFPIFGSVAASKYLHFSAPRLIPMWDRSIRLSRKHTDSPLGFLAYIEQFGEELKQRGNLRAAFRVYPTNAVRGWDVVNMKRRSQS